MNPASIERPIIVVSVGRSGSTLFHDVLSLHPNVAWLTPFANRFPRHPRLGHWVMRAADIPGARGLIRRYFTPREAYELWEHYAKGFRRPIRDLEAGDLTEKVRRDVLAALSSVPTRRRRRLALKVTGWPRVGYLAELFTDARFIHLVRDGRAVANSLIQMPWWWGWRGPQNWRFGDLGEGDRQEWERHDRSFVVLAGIQWRMLLATTEAAFARLDPTRSMTVRYEDLCARPMDIYRDVAEFTGLEWTDSFERAIAGHRFSSANAKYLNDLTDDQARRLEDVLRPTLDHYGYT